jgi:enediyne biosynthesis protein E4
MRVRRLIQGACAAGVALLLSGCPSDSPRPADNDPTAAAQRTADAGTTSAAQPAPDASRPEQPAPHAYPPEKPAPPGSPLAVSAGRILDQIQELETQKDVTCWTSFRQLDSFVAAGEYSDYATLTKIAATKSLTRSIWRKAASGGGSVTAERIDAVAALETVTLPEERRQALGEAAGAIGLKQFTDYRKTSEHWRIVLSLVQDEMRRSLPLPALDAGGEDRLAEAATKLGLALLVRSGELALIGKSPFIEGHHVKAAYRELADKYGLGPAPDVGSPVEDTDLKRLTRRLIDAKIAALRGFNPSSGSVHGDLQKISKVELAPEAVDVIMEDLRSFAGFLAAGKSPMRSDNYLAGGSSAPSALPGRAYVDAVYAENAVQQLFPHAIAANGDLLLRFEPNPGTKGSKSRQGQDIKLLDHQQNAVRDSAAHWVVMAEVHNKAPFAMDPFAAEYISEVVSMKLTLHLRRAQTLSRQLGKDRIDADIARRVNTKLYVMVPPRAPTEVGWAAPQQKRKLAVMAAYQSPRFEDVSATEGFGSLGPVGSGAGDIQVVMGSGIAVGDVDGNGTPDLYLGGEGLGRLLLGRGDFTFDDVTEKWGVPTPLPDARGCLFFDRDGDGDLDLLILRSRGESLLLEQDGGKFVDATERLGFHPGKGAHVASVFDYDGDGDLDIFVGFYGSLSCNVGRCVGRNLPSLDGLNGSPNQLWRNDGDRYLEVGAKAGVAHTGWNLAAGAFDHDGDGDTDLYLANDFGANVFLQNEGERFTDVTVATRTGDRGSGMNVSFSDLDNDGRWDFYVTNIDMFSKNIKVIFPTDDATVNLDDATLRSFRYLAGNKLYRAGPKGAYTSVERTVFEPGDRGWAWAGLFFDYENDGDEDLYLSNGWIDGSYAAGQKNQLFVRDGATFFVGPDGAEAFAGNSRSVAAADFDGDGDVDLVVNNFRQAPVALRNVQATGNRWLGLDLRSPNGNTRAVGAQVTVQAGRTKMRRLVTCGQDYLGQQDDTLVVGLGRAGKATVTVLWPNGATTVHKNLAAGAVHELKPE